MFIIFSYRNYDPKEFLGMQKLIFNTGHGHGQSRILNNIFIDLFINIHK